MPEYLPEVGERITRRLNQWRLTTAAVELVERLVAGGHQDALVLLDEVFETEADTRRGRRVERLRKASRLPPGKTLENLDRTRVPRIALQRILELARGDFLDQANNVLVFGLPGVGKATLPARSDTPLSTLVEAFFLFRPTN